MPQGSKTGKGGKTFDEREIAKRVRNLALKECEKWLLKGKGKMYEAVLLRLATNVLPRLNAGRDDDEPLIPAPLLNSQSNGADSNSNQETPPVEGGNESD